MKILFITPLDTSSVSVRSRLSLLSRLVDKHEVTLIAPDANYIPATNITIRSGGGKFYSFSRCYAKFLLNIVEEMKKDYDLIYAHRADLHSGIFGIPPSKIKRMPLVVDADDYETSSFPAYGTFKEVTMKFLVKAADGIIVASRELLELCKEWRGSKANVFYIPASVDLVRFDPSRFKGNKKLDEIIKKVYDSK